MGSTIQMKNDIRHEGALDIVSKVKDLNKLKSKYGFTQEEIDELQGIKSDGKKEIKKVQVSNTLKKFDQSFLFTDTIERGSR